MGILLTGTSALLQVVTGGTQAIHVQANWVDLTATPTATPGSLSNIITSATTTTIVGSPASSTQRNVKELTVFNTSSTTAETVTIQHVDGLGNTTTKYSNTLNPGYSVQYDDLNGFKTVDNNGNILTAIGGDELGIAAGASTVTVGTVNFSASNGIAFGLSGSTMTAQLASMGSWANGEPTGTIGTSSGFLSVQPIVIPYNLTATNMLWLASFSNITNSSGQYTASVGLYSLNGGTTGSLSLMTQYSASFSSSWTSGAALSSATAVQYRQLPLGTWSLPAGSYVFGMALAPTASNQPSVTLFTPAGAVSVASGSGASLSNLVLAGYSQASVAALPSSIGVTNTASYIRSGTSAVQQPWICFQGT